jgi:hypothetical protein
MIVESCGSFLERINFFLECSAALDVGIIPHRSPPVSQKLLVDATEGAIFLPPWFFDTVLMVLVVLIFRGVIFIFSHL